MNELVARALVSVGISVTKEPNGLSRSYGKRPDGLSLVPWEKGKPLTWDMDLWIINTYARDNCQKHGLRQSVKVMLIKQQRSLYYVTKCCVLAAAILDPLTLLHCPYLSAHQICVFSKMAAAAILDLLFLNFGLSTMPPLLCSMFPANGVMISLNLSKILRFYHIAILA